jgi:hypothetical protein
MLFTLFLFAFPARVDSLVRVSRAADRSGDGIANGARDDSDPVGERGESRIRILLDEKDEFVGWARKFSLLSPIPFVTACCAMEFMAVSVDALRHRPLRRGAAADSRRASRTC